MKPSTQDKIEGTLHEIKGKVKKAAGQASNNPGLTRKGQAEAVAGAVQKRVGQFKKVFGK